MCRENPIRKNTRREADANGLKKEILEWMMWKQKQWDFFFGYKEKFEISNGGEKVQEDLDRMRKNWMHFKDGKSRGKVL